MSDEEIVSNRTLVLDCLEEVARNNSPVFLTPCDTPDACLYESRFQSVKPDKDLIILNKVLPADWRESITPETKLEVRSSMNLGVLRFAGYLALLDDSANDPYCRLTLPTKIYRTQLRDYYRVSLTNMDATASIQLAEGVTLKGTCRDISITGAQFALQAQDVALESGQEIEHCNLVIPDLLDLHCRGKICSLKSTEREIVAGIQFLGLSDTDVRPIGAALNKIERQNIHN